MRKVSWRVIARRRCITPARPCTVSLAAKLLRIRAQNPNQSERDRSCCRPNYGHPMVGVMRKIQLKDAKAKLSTVVDQAARGKPSVITRHGKPAAVVLGFADWERLSRVPSFGRLLMAAPIASGDLPKRNRAPLRDVGC